MNRYLTSAIEQALSSILNLGVNLLLIRLTAPEQYGSFALWANTAFVVCGVQNALTLVHLQVAQGDGKSEPRLSLERLMHAVNMITLAVSAVLVLIAALILLALGVDRATVMQDYLLTNQHYRHPPMPASETPPEVRAVLWTVRVQAAEVWDAVRVEATPETRVRDVKQAAMALLLPDVEQIDSFLAAGAPAEGDLVVVAAGISDAVTQGQLVKTGSLTAAEAVANAQQAARDMADQVRRQAQIGQGRGPRIARLRRPLRRSYWHFGSGSLLRRRCRRCRRCRRYLWWRSRLRRPCRRLHRPGRRYRPHRHRWTLPHRYRWPRRCRRLRRCRPDRRWRCRRCRPRRRHRRCWPNWSTGRRRCRQHRRYRRCRRRRWRRW